MAIESPLYTVESKDGDIEIRKYDDYIVAQVDIESDYDSALTNGFRILANYIFGANHKKSNIKMTAPVTGENLTESEKIPMTVPVTEEDTSQKIAMTAPVTEEDTSEKIAMTVPVTSEEDKHIYRISFTMPSKYTMETLPLPDDDRVKIKEMKNKRAAVITFSGRAKEKLARKEIKILKKWLAENDNEPKSNFIVAQYNHPLVPGFLRHNEIIVEI
jgi:DNA gyrase inhibitor GyrI